MDIKKLVHKHIFDIKPYIPGKPVEEVQRELGLSDVLKLASNENLFGPSPKVVEAIRAAASDVNYYPDGGAYYLREKLAARFGVKFENVVVGNGTDELIRILCTATLGPEDEVVFADPSFVMYKISAMVSDATLVSVALRDDLTHDIPAMLDRVTDRTKLLFVCNPNNPTGTFNKKDDIRKLIDEVPDHVLVVFDEAYYEYADDPDYPQTLDYFKAGKDVVVLRTFSKIYGLAGLRIGYGFVSEEMGDVVHRVRNPFNVNQLAQTAAMAALDDQEHVRSAIEFCKKGRSQLYAEFDKMGLSYAPTQANFILVDVGRDSVEVFGELLKKGVIVRPGTHLGFPTRLRITMGSESDNEKLVRALKEVLGK